MSQYLKAFTDTNWTIFGFFIFFVLFLIFIASTYLPSQKKLHSYLELLPLEEGQKPQEDLT